jgi:hypothetical protein
MVMDIDRLREALTVLAAPAGAQIQYLESIGHFARQNGIDDDVNIDEIGLQFGDVEYTIRNLRDSGAIDAIIERAIRDVGKKLADLSNGRDSEFWTVEALKNDPRWEDIRRDARSCLQRL